MKSAAPPHWTVRAAPVESTSTRLLLSSSASLAPRVIVSERNAVMSLRLADSHFHFACLYFGGSSYVPTAAVSVEQVKRAMIAIRGSRVVIKRQGRTTLVARPVTHGTPDRFRPPGCQNWSNPTILRVRPFSPRTMNRPRASPGPLAPAPDERRGARRPRRSYPKWAPTARFPMAC
jgi:hypothetical protein